MWGYPAPTFLIWQNLDFLLRWADDKIMERIKEIIELIEITGDKCVILHQEREAFVVMKLDDYKKLVGNITKSEANTNISRITKPETDIRLYEIPRLEEENDQYWPEPLE